MCVCRKVMDSQALNNQRTEPGTLSRPMHPTACGSRAPLGLWLVNLVTVGRVGFSMYPARTADRK